MEVLDMIGTRRLSRRESQLARLNNVERRLENTQVKLDAMQGKKKGDVLDLVR